MQKALLLLIYYTCMGPKKNEEVHAYKHICFIAILLFAAVTIYYEHISVDKDRVTRA